MASLVSLVRKEIPAGLVREVLRDPKEREEDWELLGNQGRMAPE